MRALIPRVVEYTQAGVCLQEVLEVLLWLDSKLSLTLSPEPPLGLLCEPIVTPFSLHNYTTLHYTTITRWML